MMFDQKGRAVEYIEMLAVPDRMALRMELGSGQVAPRSGTTAAKPSRVKKHR
jgi:hypothetical protein